MELINKTSYPFLRDPLPPEQFEQKTNIFFTEKKLLKQAFVHRSWLNENRRCVAGSNERLEFLGDAVIELIVTNYLYKTYPELQEGQLTKYRSALVKANTFSQTAHELGMNNYILLSEGQKRDMDRSLKNILADTFEAFVGAVFLDQGYATAEGFIHKYLLSKTTEVVERNLSSDWKSLLQEKAQAMYSFTPQYEVTSETGPDHNKVFVVEVFYGDTNPAKGTGTSKRAAELQAAREALESNEWF